LPELCSDLYAAWRAGDFAGAKEIQLRVLPASRKIVAEMGPAGVKYAMDRAGYYGGQPRAPLLPLTEAQKGIVEDALSSLLPAALS
jgi:dihydrodipicolinate synthase/N-acetylneuraminate lyase